MRMAASQTMSGRQTLGRPRAGLRVPACQAGAAVGDLALLTATSRVRMSAGLQYVLLLDCCSCGGPGSADSNE